MRVLSLVLSAILALGSGPALACSVFTTAVSKDRYVAKNFDWSTHEGFLVVNGRGMQRSALYQGGPTWQAKYGSMSLTVLGPGLPVSGMNERGLVVESLVNYDAQVGGGDGALVSLEWAQYVLDQFETAAEVKKSLETVQPRQMAVPLHFFVCDKSGDCLVVEPDGKRVDVIAEENLKTKVLANAPWSKDYKGAREYSDSMMERLFTMSYRSHARFGKIYAELAEEGKWTRTRLLDTLEDAKISSLNRWQILWNQSDLRFSYRIRTGDVDGQFRKVDFAKVDFSCESSVRVMPLATDTMKWRSYKKSDQKIVASRLRAMMGVRKVTMSTDFASMVGRHTGTGQCQNLAQ